MSRRSRKAQPLKDWHLWTAVTDTVQPLRPLPATLAEEPLPIPEAAGSPTRLFLPTMPSYQAPPQRQKSLPAPGLEPKMRRSVARGRIGIDATLDLHGMHQNEARTALQRFLSARQARGDRTILVITGKGLKKLDPAGTQIVERGVLRSMLPIWLGEPALAPMIAGWDVAAQGHGGEGAYYVRLKRVEK